ncbi:MAG: methionine--tRNA ligase [Alphaproteobacteria bacterium]|nr:methionine--tRNA ligase [Alphaproteobacteria bacterium]
MNKQKYLITSALPYINGLPHLGHMVGCLLPSDVYARFMRMQGADVLYICGTDEHGTASEVAALKAGVPVQQYCDEFHEKHKKTYADFNLSFDYLGRTSTEQNKEITYRISSKLMENGYIEEKTIKQIFSVDDNQFLADRYITGTCPYCGYDKARGDQCENCTKVLDPTDLINARSTISGSTNLEVRETKHLFLKLTALQSELKKWLETKEFTWPEVAYSIAQKWLNEGLQPRCITRDLKWGFPVNKPGFENKVFYVWFDAPIGYIGITKQWSDEKPTERNWEDWWLKPDDVHYVEFMGKDNVPYHTITFPATLMGTGENWKLVDYLKGMSYLTFNGGKFSKSEQIGIFCDQAIEEFPADYWRYWLMANAPESSDSSFTFEGFANTINKDLNDVLGNFINRVLKMTTSNFGQQVPDGGVAGDDEEALYTRLDELVGDYTSYMKEMEFRKALGSLREIWVEGNNYIARNEPWKVVKVDKDRAAVILRTAINMIRLFAILSAPIMPDTSKKMLQLLNLPTDNLLWVGASMSEFLTLLEIGHAFNTPELLFSKITPERVEELSIRYKEKKENE